MRHVPVGRLRQRLPVERKQLQQVVTAHQMLPDAHRDFRQAYPDLAHELDVGDQQEVYERDPGPAPRTWPAARRTGP